VTVAGLFAPVASIHGGRVYGIEADFRATFRATHWLRISAEYDFMVPGNFFSQNQILHKMIVGLDLTYEYDREG
jgi:hypothetical protein